MSLRRRMARGVNPMAHAMCITQELKVRVAPQMRRTAGIQNTSE